MQPFNGGAAVKEKMKRPVGSIAEGDIANQDVLGMDEDDHSAWAARLFHKERTSGNVLDRLHEILALAGELRIEIESVMGLGGIEERVTIAVDDTLANDGDIFHIFCNDDADEFAFTGAVGAVKMGKAVFGDAVVVAKVLAALDDGAGLHIEGDVAEKFEGSGEIKAGRKENGSAAGRACSLDGSRDCFCIKSSAISCGAKISYVEDARV